MLDNRSCNCGCSQNMNNNCDYTPQGINAAFGYNTATLTDTNNSCNCNSDMQTRYEMLQEIRELNFAIIDLSEYLNTHPDDQKALCLHREYCKQFKNLTEKYQKVYGPLSIYCPCNKWRWLEEPWPWEGGEL